MVNLKDKLPGIGITAAAAAAGGMIKVLSGSEQATQLATPT